MADNTLEIVQEAQSNFVPFEYTLRPQPYQPEYVPVVGEPYNPPPVATYLHLQVQLPFPANRYYGLAVDWFDSAGMTPSATKAQSLASEKVYSIGVLELTDDGKIVAHYTDEHTVEQAVVLTGDSAEYIKQQLVKLLTGAYAVAQQIDMDSDESDESDDGDEEEEDEFED